MLFSSSFFLRLLAGSIYTFIMTDKKRKFNRIKIVLIEKEKNNIWLADQLGVSQAAVSKWCTNDNQPSVETLFKIAEVLNVGVCELLNIK